MRMRNEANEATAYNLIKLSCCERESLEIDSSIEYEKKKEFFNTFGDDFDSYRSIGGKARHYHFSFFYTSSRLLVFSIKILHAARFLFFLLYFEILLLFHYTGLAVFFCMGNFNVEREMNQRRRNGKNLNLKIVCYLNFES